MQNDGGTAHEHGNDHVMETEEKRRQTVTHRGTTILWWYFGGDMPSKNDHFIPCVFWSTLPKRQTVHN